MKRKRNYEENNSDQHNKERPGFFCDDWPWRTRLLRQRRVGSRIEVGAMQKKAKSILLKKMYSV